MSSFVDLPTAMAFYSLLSWMSFTRERLKQVFFSETNERMNERI